MPWASKAKALIQAWYGGNETGNGIADVIYGTVNPSAKLPLTFPKRLKDNPAYLNYRSEAGRVLYGEDVYVGYRYYEEMEIEPLFSFGHGLSYTSFNYSNLETTTLKSNLSRLASGRLEVGGRAERAYRHAMTGYVVEVYSFDLQSVSRFTFEGKLDFGVSRCIEVE